MRAVEVSGGVCRVGERAVPAPGDGEYLLKAHYSAINRADTLQRKGQYPPPPGAPDSLGLEVVGEVIGAGPGAAGGFKPGDRVMALLAGGGNAEYVTVPGGQLMRIPEALDYKHAAAVPETWLTAFQLLHFVGHAKRGETVVVHAAGSGVGTAAVQLAIGAGCKVIAVAGSDEKLAAVRALAEETVRKIRASAVAAGPPAAAPGSGGSGEGAAEGGAHSGEPGELLATVNYKSNAEWGKAVGAASPGGHGVQLVLDPVGGSFWRGNVDALAMGA
jgi:NADPH:quinone reductase-like Zn-dependent oxidoreductase